MFLNTIVHSRSKTLASYLAMFCFGVGLGSFLPVVETATGALLVLGMFVCGLLVQTRKQRVVLFSMTCLLFGIFRLQQAALPDPVVTIADRTGASIRVEGVIDGEVEKRVDHTRVVLDEVSVADESVEGKLLVRLPLHPEVFYGDTLVFSCALETPEPFEGFAYDRYLAVRGIYAVCSFPQYIDIRSSDQWTLVGSVLGIKQVLVGGIEKSVPEPHAAFLTGLLFGGSSSLSSELKDDFASTGTSHILAASGFNVSLFSLVFLGWVLQTRVGRKKGLLLTLVLMLVYTITAGATPAVIRAVLMGSVVLVQHWINRRAFMLNVLLLTAGLMLAANPLLLLDDIGFQLSFAATAAVVTLTESISTRLSFLPKRIGIREALAGSLAAILVTTPILLWQFGEISLMAPIANLLVLPLVPFAMVATIAVIVAGLVSSTFATVVALPAWALSSVMLWIIRVLSAVDFALVEPVYSQVIAGGFVILASWIIVKLKTYES